jgi:sugar/nucleoside kinase (ribokinase family)
VPVDLLTLGEAFEDLVFLGLPRLPNSGEEIRTDHFVRTIGGGAVITAVAAARLGLPCGTWSALGDLAVRRLKREGVAVSNLKAAGEDHAISAALSTADNRSFVTYDGVNRKLERRLLERTPRIRCRHVHFAFGPRDCAPWLDVLARLHRRGVGTSWDFGWNERLLDDAAFPALLDRVQVLFVNEQEALLYSRRRSLPTAMSHWRRAANTVIVKVGPKGCHWISRDRELHDPAPRVRTVDTTGAGDAFNGGFLVARLRGLSPAASLRLGNHVGALSTRRAGGLDGLPQSADLPLHLTAVRARSAAGGR